MGPMPPNKGGMGQPIPNPQLPPRTGGIKMSSLVNPANDHIATDGSIEVFVKEPTGQFVGYQPGGMRPFPPGQGGPNPGGPNPGGPNPGGPGGRPQPGGPGGRGGPGPNPNPMPGPGPGPNPMPGPNPKPGPGPNPNPMPGPGPGPNPNPMPGPGPNPNPNPNPNPKPKPTPPPARTGSYLTVQPEMKAILDKVDNDHKGFLVVVAYGHSKLAAEIGQRLLDAIPRAGDRDDSPAGGFGGDSEQKLKSKVDPFHSVHLLALSVTALYETKVQATLALEARDDDSRVELDKSVALHRPPDAVLLPWSTRCTRHQGNSVGGHTALRYESDAGLSESDALSDAGQSESNAGHIRRRERRQGHGRRVESFARWHGAGSQP